MGFKARDSDPTCICHHTADGTEVLDSRSAGLTRRRRRQCTKCGRKFTTYEFELPRDTGELRVRRASGGGVSVSKLEVVNMPVIQETRPIFIEGSKDE